MEYIPEVGTLPILDNWIEVFELNGKVKRVLKTREEIKRMYEKPKITSNRPKV